MPWECTVALAVLGWRWASSAGPCLAGLAAAWAVAKPNMATHPHTRIRSGLGMANQRRDALADFAAVAETRSSTVVSPGTSAEMLPLVVEVLCDQRLRNW